MIVGVGVGEHAYAADEAIGGLSPELCRTVLKDHESNRLYRSQGLPTRDGRNAVPDRDKSRR